MNRKHPSIYLQAFNNAPTIYKLASAPFIYWMVVPIMFLDISLEIYHQVSFRLYGIPLVKRSKYIFIDRHKLKRLTFMQKLNCVYCGYANGVMAYGVKVAGETEKYWCAIRHISDESLNAQPHQRDFIDRSEFS